MKLNKGINIGDHFECRRPTDGSEWVNPVKDWYYDTIKSLGFDHIRLPVRWSDYTDDEKGYKIEQFFMDEVKETVKKFLDYNLAVILNVHHFTGAVQDPKGYEDKLYSMWEQIGENFKDFSNELIFEVMNEPQTMVDPDEWNEVQNNAVAVIRKSNPTRKVMIGGVYWNNSKGLALVVPPKDDNIIGTFHHYEPMPFTHQGARWSPENYDYKDVKWHGTPEEVADIEEGMLIAKEWGDKFNIPVNLGEFGAYQTGDMESRAKWTECVRRAAEKLGFSFTYWEFNHGFGIFNMQEMKLNQPLVDALLGE